MHLIVDDAPVIRSTLNSNSHVPPEEIGRRARICELTRDPKFSEMADGGFLTFGMIKPNVHLAHPDNMGAGDDAVTRRIISAVREPLVVIARADFIIPRADAEDFYGHLRERPDVFQRVIDFMTSGAVTGLIMQTQGDVGNAIELWRDQIGPTNPEKALPGTIRGDFAETIEHNAVHGSDSVESVRREIAWFIKMLT